MIMSWIKFNSFLLFLLFALQSSANDFRYYAPLTVPDSSGFFKIQISPSINSKVKNDFSDLRLVDSHKKEIPFILKTDDKDDNKSLFHEYEIISKNFYPDSITQIIIKNNTGKNISDISMIVRNADVNKEMKIAGSFDRKQWYVVKNAENISSLLNNKNVSEVRLINFPLTNYLYYRVEINDRNSEPVDVISIGSYIEEVSKPNLLKLSSRFSVSDSAKTKSTWIHIYLDEYTFVDEVEFSISSPSFYNRKANIYTEVTNAKNNNPYPVSQITINSKSFLKYKLSITKRNDLWVEIFNEDNPPLHFENVSCYQYNQYIIAQLEAGKSYQLLFGDSNAVMPQYDLHYFESLIPASLKILTPGKISEIAFSTIAPPSKSFFKDKRFIWAVLIIVVSFLGIVTFRMLKERREN